MSHLKYKNALCVLEYLMGEVVLDALAEMKWTKS